MSIISASSSFLNRLDYTNLNNLEKTLIDNLIVALQKDLEGQCNRVFAAADYAEKHDGDGERNIFVKNPPINSLTSVVVTSSSSTTVDDADLTYDSETGEIRWKDWDLTSTADFVGFFPIGFQNITINYNGGYTSFPEDLQLLLAEAVIQVFDRREAHGQIQTEKMGNEYLSYGREFFKNLMFTHKKTLSRYKRRFA